MRSDQNLKMYTPRHFLFHMGIAGIVGLAIGVAKGQFGWGDGLTFGVAVVAMTIASTFAVREGLFGPSRRSDRRRV
jgi:hypothetical protein